MFIGAAAISVLAGAQILQLPPSSLQAAVHAVIAGLSVVLWAFGTWLIPLLIVAGVWRHVARRVPLAYKPGPWSLGRSMAALAIWAVVPAAMIAAYFPAAAIRLADVLRGRFWTAGGRYG